MLPTIRVRYLAAVELTHKEEELEACVHLRQGLALDDPMHGFVRQRRIAVQVKHPAPEPIHELVGDLKGSSGLWARGAKQGKRHAFDDLVHF